MNELLDEVAGRANTVIPPDADVDDLEPLAVPLDEEFRVAAMGLAWDGNAHHFHPTLSSPSSPRC